MSNKSSNGRGKEPGTENKSKNTLPKPLKASEVYRICQTSSFDFKTTGEVDETNDFIAQQRAVRAINMGLGIRKPGYNIYVAGYIGTGKTSVIRSFLEKISKKAPTPNDWIYVYNFDNPEHPRAITLPKGEGRKFKKVMDNFIKDLRVAIPNALQSEDFETAVNTYMSSANERKSRLFSELEKMAKAMDFTVKSSHAGIETVPVLDGRAISEKEYGELNEKQRDDIESKRSRLEPEILDFARKVRTIENETKEYIESLRAELGQNLVGELIEPIVRDFADINCEAIADHLKRIKEHIIENLLDFVEEDGEDEEEEMFAQEERDPLRKYAVNLFVDNSEVKGAPVLIETNPTFYNLFGKIEKNVDHGTYLTDFALVKNGSIHRANGGYLVLNATDIFKTQAIWETLKRVLRNREAFIEDMGEQFSFVPTSGLRPQPIPLDLKVILIGNEDIYHILLEEDEEFTKIFKIKADFDYKMPRTAKNETAYVSFVATRVAKEGLLPFDRSAIAAIVEYGSRAVEDQRLLSTQFGELKDLTIEADYLAREEGSKTVKRQHVEAALDEKYYRHNMMKEQIYEMVQNEDILLTVSGSRIGQINGLTVYDMGDFAFGKPCRITCTTSISDDGIINVERASRLSGRSHDKGIYILSGILNACLAREYSLGLSASVVFEQSYGLIDGDSASCAELIAIISAMAEIPVDQSFSVTGSINQMGEIQAIGGINEKVEGFYEICRMIGKSKTYNLILPYQNVANLMLHREVVEAVKNNDFRLYPVRHLWEAFELVTGVPLGIKDVNDKTFTKGSAFEIIKGKLKRIHEKESKNSKKHPQHDQKTRAFPKVAKSNT